MATAIPILPCRDLDATLAFYGVLGFTLDFEQLEPSPYAIVSFADAELHFFAAPELDARGALAAAYLRVTDADAVHRVWSQLGLPAQGAPSLSEIADREWGMREFALVDPSGNRLRVGSRLE
jgi:catechol 2,3-dioxygenase-like lactoylglutathione lyase family enzyme